MNKKTKKPDEKSTIIYEDGDKKVPFDLYVIEWIDHMSHGAGWTPLKQVEGILGYCKSCGWKVAEDDLSITIAQTMSNKGAAGEFITIVKSCIQKQIKL